jgi:hypothetical protein
VITLPNPTTAITAEIMRPIFETLFFFILVFLF